ncbi:MAG: response regulator, partial [Sphingobacteriales bacterium]
MKQNILVVDDDDDILSALNMLLKSEGYAPVIANSPENALVTFRAQDFSLILMDLNYSMDTTSGEEGLRLITAIRQIDEFVPIVVMTGWGTIEVAVSTMKNGANDFIQKPWENDRLLTIIKNQTKLADMQQQS